MRRTFRRLLLKYFLRPLRQLLRRLWTLGCRAMLLVSLGIIAFNGIVASTAYPQFALVIAAVAGWQRLRRGWVPSGNFGTARFSVLADVIGRMTGDRGWFFGRDAYLAPPSRGQALRWLLWPFVKSEDACKLFVAAFARRLGGGNSIRVSDGVHAGIFAPAGAGKTTKVLGPNLLSFDGNCVVIDPKGELYTLTHEHREKRFGHDIIRLDPAELCGPGANRFNVFDDINPHADDFIDTCRDRSNMLVVKTGKEPEPFWGDAAETVIAAFIAHVCACEPDKELRNLRNMRRLIASREAFAFALEAMRNNKAYRGVLEQLGMQLGWHVDKQLAGVMGHAQRHTDIFDSPLIVDATSSTDWNPADLRSGKGMTVYLVVPPDKLVVWAGLMRLWLGCILRIATRGKPTEQNPLTFFVDEAAHIGRMQALEDAITMLRGSGVRVWLFFQSIDQLNKCFGDHAPTVLDNLATQLYFSIYSYTTAEALAKRIGCGTVVNVTDGDNEGDSSPFGGDGRQGGSRTRGSSRSCQEASRQLLMPEEILTLDDSVGLLFHKNRPVIVCQLIKYYSDCRGEAGAPDARMGCACPAWRCPWRHWPSPACSPCWSPICRCRNSRVRRLRAAITSLPPRTRGAARRVFPPVSTATIQWRCRWSRGGNRHASVEAGDPCPISGSLTLERRSIMPEPERSVERGRDQDTGRYGGVLGVVLLPFEMFGNAVKAVVQAITRDGTLEAFGRQGIDELGAALKAFPDSIQREETGTLWSPTQAEITASRRPDRHKGVYSSLTPPAGWTPAAESNQQQQSNGQDKSKGQDQGMSM
jgi:type IV secretion system protein VirD4